MEWRGETVALIGGGPSLKGLDLEVLRDRAVVLAINDAVLHAPWAEACLTIDVVWLRRRRAVLEEFKGERIAAVPDDFPRDGWPVDTWLKRRRLAGLSSEPGVIHTGENSGFAALGLAITRGAARVALLGYDMRPQGGHFHAGYEWRTRYGVRHYRTWVRYFPSLADEARRRKVDVVNCNPNSAIKCFRFGSLEEVLR